MLARARHNPNRQTKMHSLPNGQPLGALLWRRQTPFLAFFVGCVSCTLPLVDSWSTGRFRFPFSAGWGCDSTPQTGHRTAEGLVGKRHIAMDPRLSMLCLLRPPVPSGTGCHTTTMPALVRGLLLCGDERPCLGLCLLPSLRLFTNM